MELFAAAFKSTILLYFLAALGASASAVFGVRWLRLPTALAVWAGLAAHTGVLGHQIWISGRPPLSNMYETDLLLAWFVVVVSLILEIKHKTPILAAFTLPIAVCFLGLASFNVKEALPLMPSLRSNWLLIHVLACSIAYAAFALAFACGAFYLIFERGHSERTPFFGERASLLRWLDAVGLQMVDFGFPFLTIGIATGAVWADLCWGTYWSWDPKETWSLVTWLVYAICLHMRHVHSWRGGWAAAACVVGFVCVLCTYWGVNYFFSSLHAYA